MNPEISTVKTRSNLRLILLWMFGLMGVSALALAAIAVNLLTLNREAAALRKAMFAATGVSAKTVVQLDIGPAWIAASRAIVACVPQVPDEARLALKAARRACVGVYQIPHGTQVRDGAALMARADEMMAARGWTRTVGVMQKSQTVLLYVPKEAESGDVLHLCVAVCEGSQIVVVSAEVAAQPLQELIALKGGFRGAQRALR